jgi:hypothetical protein
VLDPTGEKETEVLPHVDAQVIAALIMLALTEVGLARETLHRRRDRDRQQIVLVLVARACVSSTTTSPPSPGPQEEAGQAAALESTP